MATGPIYIVHPPESQFPGISEWLREVANVTSDDPEWSAFPLRPISTRDDLGFRVTDVLSRVASESGPVLIFKSTQTSPRQQVRMRLARKTVVQVTNPMDCAELLADLRRLRDLFASGDPQLPRRLVATVLIIRKLYTHKYWGGSHQKNFIWSDDIANGRGVSPDFKDVAQDIANFLHLRGILVAKYGSGKRRAGKRQKYALSRQREEDVRRLANDGERRDERLNRWLYKDNATASARCLDGWKPIKASRNGAVG